MINDSGLLFGATLYSSPGQYRNDLAETTALGGYTDQVVMVVWKSMFAVVPSCEDSLSVRVVRHESNEPIGALRQELNDTPHLWFGFGLFATILFTARIRAGIGYARQQKDY